MPITFWQSVYSIIQVFSFSTTSGERISGWRENVGFQQFPSSSLPQDGVCRFLALLSTVGFLFLYLPKCEDHATPALASHFYQLRLHPARHPPPATGSFKSTPTSAPPPGPVAGFPGGEAQPFKATASSFWPACVFEI